MPYPTYGYPTYPISYPQNIMPTINAPQYSRPYIPGRIVSTVDEIQPNEVAMDGSISFFPTKDCKSIFAKQWNKDGTISTIEYQPVQQQTAAEKPLDPSLTAYIDEKFASLEKLVKQQRKPYQKKEASDANGSQNVRA